MALPIQSTPTYTTVLPSNGEEVKYRPFLVKEQKVLVMAREGENNKQIMDSVKTLIHAVTFEKVDANKLATIDLEWLFLKIRAVSVGETSKLVLKCNHDGCTGSIPFDLNIDEIEVKGEFPDDNKVMISDTVGVTVRPPSVKDTEGLEDLDPQLQAVEVVKRSMVNIFDQESIYNVDELNQKDIDEFFDNLTFAQLNLLGEWFDRIPKLSHTVNVTCEQCGNTREQTLEGIQSFF